MLRANSVEMVARANIPDPEFVFYMLLYIILIIFEELILVNVLAVSSNH